MDTTAERKDEYVRRAGVTSFKGNYRTESLHAGAENRSIQTFGVQTTREADIALCGLPYISAEFILLGFCIFVGAYQSIPGENKSWWSLHLVR